MIKRLTFMIIALVSFTTGAMAQFESAPAFPGAEGFARFITGGRGGAVYHVTKLTDDGSEGTFRWACNQSGKRTIVFDVSGTIYLTSALSLGKGNVSILGQTAPGDGICIADYPFTIKSSNVILRFLRFRLGNRQVAYHEGDGLGGMDQQQIIVDHCSVSWSIDECLSVYGSKNISVQWNMVDQSLVNSGHSKGAHGFGGNWGGSGASYHHNLMAHHTSREPRLGPRPGTQTDERMDLRNCVFYNWGGNGCYGGEGMNVNIVNNYYQPGPGTGSSVGRRIASPGCRTTEYCEITQWNADGTPANGNGWAPMWHVWGDFYVTGNVNSKYSDVTNDNWTYGIWNQITLGSYDGTYNQTTKDTMRVETPIPYGYVTTQKAVTAYLKVLDYCGASLHRDSHDAYIVEDVKKGEASHCAPGTTTGFIDNQDQAGGWPELNSTAAPLDTDQDGMPDEWETAHGLDPNDAADRNKYNLDSHRYYTNLEVYCNSLVEDIIKAQNALPDETVEGNFEEYYPDYQNGETDPTPDPGQGGGTYVTSKKWDFTQWSSTSTANLAADAAWTYDGSTYTLSNELSNEALTANGVTLAETDGLLFSSAAGKLVIYSDRIRMNKEGSTITVPGCKKDERVQATWRSANTNDERGFTITNLSKDDMRTTAQATDGGTVLADGDVVLTVTGGIHISSIELQQLSGDGIATVNSDQRTGSSACYNLAGQRVSSSARGIIIQGGRKIFNK